MESGKKQKPTADCEKLILNADAECQTVWKRNEKRPNTESKKRNQKWRTLKFIQPSRKWHFSAEEKDEKLHIKEVKDSSKFL